MEFEGGSKEPLDSWLRHFDGRTPVVPMPVLKPSELDRIADGEPYCFRCGKPASSFAEYCDDDGECGGPPYPDAVAYVRSEEGTYNPDTNRFACDECYIAIGTPVGEPDDDYAWKAP